MLIAVIGWVVLDQRLDTPAVAGMALIVAGVVVINVFSSTAAH
jgi:small multidrug resistance pump